MTPTTARTCVGESGFMDGVGQNPVVSRFVEDLCRTCMSEVSGIERGPRVDVSNYIELLVGK